MKRFLPLLLLPLCGCRTAAPVAMLPTPTPIASGRPQPPVSAIVPIPLAHPMITVPDQKSRKQAQLIEALINQNDALTARLTAMQGVPTVAAAGPETIAAAASPSPVASVAPPIPVLVAADSTISPNAEGVIDLAAIEHAGSADEPVNPFAVRTMPGDKSREVSLLVGGIILGGVPCAVVNERLVQAGDSFEGFAVEHIESGAVILRFGSHRLRLPISTVATRVKLPL